MRTTRSIAALGACLVLGSSTAGEDRWTEFRGPSGTGHSDSTGLPREWSETKNVAWKTAIHGRGWSSPVVLGNQVWLTTATRDGRELSVLALDRDSGRVVHDIKLFEVAKPEDTARFNSFASPTPVIEDGRVYVHFGSYGTAALDTRTGKTVWERRDLPCNHWRGPGSSPMLHGELLIVHFDGYDLQYAVALDKKTGRTVWKAERTHDFATDDGDMKKAFATPVVIEAGGRQQLVSQAAKAVLALDPKTGRELWQRPLRVALGRHPTALRPGAALRRHRARPVRPDRDPARRHRGRHRHPRRLEGHAGHRLEPVSAAGGDLIYAVSDKGGVVTCLDAKTGAEVWQQRTGAAAPHGFPALRGRRLVLLRRGRLGARSRARPRVPRARPCQPRRGRRHGNAGDRRPRDLPPHRVAPLPHRDAVTVPAAYRAAP